MHKLTRPQLIVSYLFQIIAAVILINAGYLKLTDNPMSIFVFHELGIDGTLPVIGVLEVFTGVLLLTNHWANYGAILGFGTMLGALIAHVTVIGFVVYGDQGITAALMVVVIITTLSIMWIRRKTLPMIGHTFS